MIRHHLGRHLTETQRRRWATRLMDCADEAGLPSDPEFRAALIGYIEWGSRIAVVTSQQDLRGPGDAPMPSWDWGPPGGPTAASPRSDSRPTLGPEPSMRSHESVCLLNAGPADAHVTISLHFTDREPAGPYRMTIPARRTLHV